MGLSIHYSGQLEEAASIATLTEELQDICTILNWTYHLFNDSNFQGICFSPEGCEPVLFTFMADRRLASPFAWQVQLPTNTISVKTQFAAIDTHRALIHLLRYMSAKYFASFDLIDEGLYWETNDAAVLRCQFDRYNQAMELVADTLHGLKHHTDETAEDLVSRLEVALQKRMEEHGDDAP